MADASLYEGKSVAVLKAKLKSKSFPELREIATAVGAHRLLTNRSIAGDKSALRDAIIEYLTKPHESEEEYEHDPVWFDGWLSKHRDSWPEGAPAPPANAAEALDAEGRWGAAACGIEVMQCADVRKGNGAFATREIAEGSVVGVYWGEPLTQREYYCRHGWKSGMRLQLSAEEVAAQAERRERLAAVQSLAAAGGAQNGGSYCFQILPDTPEGSKGFGDVIAFVDAEDPGRSSWCRYINHMTEDSADCNLEAKIDARARLVWFQSRRLIRPGEELSFDCTRRAPSNPVGARPTDSASAGGGGDTAPARPHTAM